MKNWNDIGAVSLWRYIGDGRTCVAKYESLRAFVSGRAYKFDYRTQMTDNPGHAIFICHHKYFTDSRYWLVDELGMVIPLWRIEKEYNNLPNKIVRETRWWGRGRWKFGNWYRRPRTKNEMARNSVDLLDDDIYEYRVKIRPSRVGYNLPNSYDDVQRSDIRTRKNWKKSRKKQYKAPVDHDG